MLQATINNRLFCMTFRTFEAFNCGSYPQSTTMTLKTQRKLHRRSRKYMKPLRSRSKVGFTSWTVQRESNDVIETCWGNAAVNDSSRWDFYSVKWRNFKADHNSYSISRIVRSSNSVHSMPILFPSILLCAKKRTFEFMVAPPRSCQSICICGPNVMQTCT